MEPTQKQADERAARLKRLIARRVRESRSKSRFHRVNGMLMKKPAGARRGFERMFTDLEISMERLCGSYLNSRQVVASVQFPPPDEVQQ